MTGYLDNQGAFLGLSSEFAVFLCSHWHNEILGFETIQWSTQH
jgi:hypothetical protein